MPLKYTISELFRNRFVVPQKLYEILQDLDRQIQEGADAVPIVKKNIELTKKDLKKAFGDPKKFKNVGIVHNDEGSYLIIADDKNFKHLALDDI